MRASVIAAVSAVALLGGTALAQTAPPSTTTGAPVGASPGSPPQMAARTPAPNPLTMEDTTAIKGSSVYGSDDKKIGDVSTLLMKPESKTIDRLVVNSGGLLGVGGHRVALPIDDFKWDGTKDAFTIGKTADELKAMPEWKPTATANSASTSSAPSTSARVPQSSGSTGSSSGTSKTTSE